MRLLRCSVSQRELLVIVFMPASNCTDLVHSPHDCSFTCLISACALWLYPIVIELGDETTAFGVVVPDLPGCFSAGDTLEEAISNAKEAIALHVLGLVEAGMSIPQPSFPHPDYAGWLWHLVNAPGGCCMSLRSWFIGVTILCWCSMKMATTIFYFGDALAKLSSTCVLQ